MAKKAKRSYNNFYIKQFYTLTNSFELHLPNFIDGNIKYDTLRGCLVHIMVLVWNEE